MDNTNVIIKPLVTEKSTHQQATRNVYTFMVHKGANKPEIKRAVESLFQVKVRGEPATAYRVTPTGRLAS